MSKLISSLWVAEAPAARLGPPSSGGRSRRKPRVNSVLELSSHKIGTSLPEKQGCDGWIGSELWGQRAATNARPLSVYFDARLGSAGYPGPGWEACSYLRVSDEALGCVKALHPRAPLKLRPVSGGKPPGSTRKKTSSSGTCYGSPRAGVRFRDCHQEQVRAAPTPLCTPVLYPEDSVPSYDPPRVGNRNCQCICRPSSFRIEGRAVELSGHGGCAAPCDGRRRGLGSSSFSSSPPCCAWLCRPTTTPRMWP
jgi:hypothetical protein